MSAATENSKNLNIGISLIQVLIAMDKQNTPLNIWFLNMTNKMKLVMNSLIVIIGFQIQVGRQFWTNIYTKPFSNRRLGKTKNMYFHNSASICHRFAIFASKYMFVRVINLDKQVINGLLVNEVFKVQDGCRSGPTMSSTKLFMSDCFVVLLFWNCTAKC